jgi:hypothetical protein
MHICFQGRATYVLRDELALLNEEVKLRFYDLFVGFNACRATGVLIFIKFATTGEDRSIPWFLGKLLSPYYQYHGGISFYPHMMHKLYMVMLVFSENNTIYTGYVASGNIYGMKNSGYEGRC